MRGKVQVRHLVEMCLGITPAYAGKSACMSLKPGLGEDHPRMCGEKRYYAWQGEQNEGSPPRMRGKGGSMSIDLNINRITPAYAGKSPMLELGVHNTKDHPRVCGEKKSIFHGFCPQMGSPPHMRGKEIAARPCSQFARITPAHAGKRAITLIQEALFKDHPRTCGEKLLRGTTQIAKDGSPPHMRGKAQLRQEAVLLSGITPAHAGKREQSRPDPGHHPDHPRTCGEKTKKIP